MFLDTPKLFTWETGGSYHHLLPLGVHQVKELLRKKLSFSAVEFEMPTRLQWVKLEYTVEYISLSLRREKEMHIWKITLYTG